MKHKIAKTTAVIFILLTIAMINSCSPASTEATGREQELPEVPNGNEQPQSPPRVEISIEDFAYHPDTLDIPAGTTVVWYNNDSVVHTVTAQDESFNSGSMPGGAEFSHTFDIEGVFEYHCIPHPFMTGKITVK